MAFWFSTFFHVRYFYGFSYARNLGFGFLLTASKNWVKIRGIHGVSLMILVGLWVFERVFVNYASDFGLILKHLGLSLFFSQLVGYDRRPFSVGFCCYV